MFAIALLAATLYADDELRVENVNGPVYELVDVRGTVWSAAANGIFRWDHGTASPQMQPVQTGKVYEISTDADDVSFGADEGVFQWRIGSDAPPQRVLAISEVYALSSTKKTIWIGTNRTGLYQWDKRSPPIPVLSPFTTSWINDVLADADTAWIGAQTGLYTWNGRKTQRLNLVTGAVYKIRKTGDSIWFATENGLYHLGKNGSMPIRESLDTGWVNDIRDAGTTVWFGAQKGLFAWSPHEPNVMPHRVPVDIKNVFAVYESDCCLWLGTEGALLRAPKSGHSFVPRLQLANTGRVYDLLAAASTLWVGSDNGLFRIDTADVPWQPDIHILPHAESITAQQESVIRWSLHQAGWRVPHSLVRQRVLVRDTHGRLVYASAVEQGRFEFVLPGLPSGRYEVHVEAFDLFNHIARSAPLLLSVHTTSSLQLLNFAQYAGIGYAVLNLLAFVGLTLGARWSYRCFIILTDPTVRVLSVYFGAALRHITIVRRWVFERYYRKLQYAFPSVQYLEITTNKIELPVVPHARIWIEGAPGTGKTELTRELMRKHTRTTSFRQTWRAKPYIPVLIPLRNYSETSALELIRDVFAAFEFPMDAAFLRSLLGTGDFLIIFDGLNESKAEADILRFCDSYPSVRVIVTSQTSSRAGFARSTLPVITGAFARSLLRLFVGDSQDIPEESSPLWDAVESAYDVRLLAELVKVGRPIPESRVGLYEATLRSARASGLTEAGYSAVCRLAWYLWLEGQYRFEASTQVTADMLAPLIATGVVVPRHGQYEFGHDLMRGYVAACWVLRPLVESWDMTAQRLSDKKIWDLSATDQHAVFPFIAGLMTTRKELQLLLRFAMERPTRKQLLMAVAEESTKRDWKWSVGEAATQ